MIREQILARIDATPYRAPSFSDLMRHTKASFNGLTLELDVLQLHREIDTENGTDGLTYRRKIQPVTVSPHAPTTLPERKENGFAFPSKNAQPQKIAVNTPSERKMIQAARVPDRMQKRERQAAEKAHLIATRAAAKKAAVVTSKRAKGKHSEIVARHLGGPVSVAEFALIAGVTKDAANSMLVNREGGGGVKSCSLGYPKMYFKEATKEEIKEARARAMAFKTASMIKAARPESAQIAQEYAAGETLNGLAAKYKTHKDSVGKILVIYGVKKRTRAEAYNLSKAEKKAKKISENERLKSRVAELVAGYREAIESMQDSASEATPRERHQLQQEVDAHRAVLDGVIESVQAYHAYLAAQLDGAHP